MELTYKYKLVTTWADIHTLVRYCKQTKYCSSDFESSGTNAMYPGSYPTILSVSFQPGSAWVIPLAHFDSPFKTNNEWIRVLKYFGREIISNPDIIKIGQNIKYEMNWWRKYDILMLGRVFDTMLAKYLLDEERPHGLKEMVSRFLPKYNGYDLPHQPSNKATNGQLINFWSNVKLDELSLYGALDADLTLRLYIFFETRLINNKFYTLFRNLLMMASRVLAEAEWNGMLVDREYLEGLLYKYKEGIYECEKQIRAIPKIQEYEKNKIADVKKQMVLEIEREIKNLKKTPGNERAISNREKKISNYLAGVFTTKKELDKIAPINFNSPVQMIDLLYENPNGFYFKVPKYTKDKNTKKESDRPSTDEESLLMLKDYDTSGFIDGLLKLRELTKINSTYVVGMWERLNSNDKIHGSFLLHGTVTGRLCIGQDCLLYTKGGMIKIGDIIPSKPGIKEIEVIEVLTHTGEYQRITHAINKGYEEMYEVELENGKIIQCTVNHVFLTDQGWMALKDITDENIISWEVD